MKKFIAAAFVLSSIFVAPGIVVTEASAQACGPDAPEAWSRPGGFCDQIGGGSLSLPAEGCSGFEYVWPVSLIKRDGPGARVHVADTCVIDCGQYYENSYELPAMQKGDRARVAAIPTGCEP